MRARSLSVSFGYFRMDWGLEKYMYSDEQFSRIRLNWSKATIAESSMEILGEPLMQMVYLFFKVYKWKKYKFLWTQTRKSSSDPYSNFTKLNN